MTIATRRSSLLSSDSRLSPPVTTRRAVVVHAGARDSYQLALGLAEAGLLEALVTDFFYSPGGVWAKLIPEKVLQKLALRSNTGLSKDRVTQLVWSGVGGLLLDKAKFLPFQFRRWMTRCSDAHLGRAAGHKARSSNCYLVSYSYYGFDAFRSLGRSDMLFQMHPHPATMRRLLTAELLEHPESAASLKLEWELALPEKDFDHLVAETEMAKGFLVASSFTRNSLIENGVAPWRVRVIPYGVDLERFHPLSKTCAPKAASPLKLLFVGRINQRKGLRYLLAALHQLEAQLVELTICGRVLDISEELNNCSFRVIVRPSVSAEELVLAYQRADLFVLPSIAEGFGQVLLEALACGIPILATTRTAAPDLIEDGVQGFIVEPQRADLLAEKIQWAALHRAEISNMGALARRRAERFTWQRFRRCTAEAVRDFMNSPEVSQGVD